MKNKKNLTTLADLIDQEVGTQGSPEREEFEKGYEAFKIGVLIQQAREDAGMTQEELAQRSGTNKSYISKLENNLKDIRFSTLKRIIQDGLGGQLEISIKIA